MPAEHVTVRGVVYGRSRAGQGRWLRLSTPPDATPGKRSKWPPTYTAKQLPAHEVIDRETAAKLIVGSLARLDALRARLRVPTAQRNPSLDTHSLVDEAQP